MLRFATRRTKEIFLTGVLPGTFALSAKLVSA